MAENKKSFVFYTSWFKYFDRLKTLEQRESLRILLRDYVTDKYKDIPIEEITSGNEAVDMAFEAIANDLKDDLIKWKGTCSKRAEAGKLGGLKKAENRKQNNLANVANAKNAKTNLANLANVADSECECDSEYDYDNSNNINYSGKELNSNNINNNILSFPESEKDCLYKQIFDYWNSKKIVVHKNMTQELIKVLDKTLKLYSKEEVGHAIKHYAEMYHDKNYFFSYKWTLIEFLTRSNGLPEFLDNGNKWVNYLNRNNNTKQQSYNSVEELPEYMQQMLKEES